MYDSENFESIIEEYNELIDEDGEFFVEFYSIFFVWKLGGARL